MTSVEKISGPELIEQAIATRNEAARDAALQRIDEKSEALRKELDAGISPAEFKRLESVRSALAIAHTVIGRAWSASAKP